MSIISYVLSRIVLSFVYLLIVSVQVMLPLTGVNDTRARTRTHTRTRTLGRTPLDEGSIRSKLLYLITHNTQKKPISTPPEGFETATPASEGRQTHVSDGVATGIGVCNSIRCKIMY
jgi:hypothetical protein